MLDEVGKYAMVVEEKQKEVEVVERKIVRVMVVVNNAQVKLHLVDVEDVYLGEEDVMHRRVCWLLLTGEVVERREKVEGDILEKGSDMVEVVLKVVQG